MKLWIDAQLSPTLATWISENFSQVEAIAIRDLGLRDSEDLQIFLRAKNEQAIVMTKDSDFVDLLSLKGAPPKIIWITCGNTSNERLKRALESNLLQALDFLRNGEDLVEITD